MELLFRATFSLRSARCFASSISRFTHLKVSKKVPTFLLTHCRNKVHWSVYNMASPGNRLRFDLTVEDINKQAEKLMQDSKDVYDAVGAVKAGEVTFENVIQALAENDINYSTERNILDFPQHVFPQKELRDASVAVDKQLSDFDVEMSMRPDVFESLVAISEKMSEKDSYPTAETQRYVERLMKLGKRNGLHLPKEIQDKVKENKKRQSELGIDFSKNLNEENTVLEFEEEELAGVPADFLKSLEKTETGKLKVTLKYPHYFPCMKFARNPNTRKTLEIAFNSRCMKENTPILEELVELRQQKADVLDYPTHAAFVLDMRMAKKAEAVKKFLEELAVKLQPLKEEEMALFLQYKKEDCEKYGYDFDGKVNMWDMRYYMTRNEERRYTVDQNKLKEYFPMDVVTTGLLDIYQELLSLKYEEILDAPTWYKDVKLYNVKDASSGELLGYFYLDLYPREGKYGHAACFGLQPGCKKADGKRQVSVAAMVANFTKATEDQPSLLTHDEVETYFHEFGHVMHQICATADYALFSGTHVERDFVEAPSQMLENWVWQKESLNRMSKHYKDGSAIPDDMLKTLVASKTANAGVFNLRQILLGTFDQTIHTMPKADTAKELSDLSEKILGIASTPNTNMAASFGHLAGGYDAQYYGYLWSEVFSADMFISRFKKEGVMSSKVGMDYRKFILGPGGSIDASEMLRNFLGRDPEQEAFLLSKGLKA